MLSMCGQTVEKKAEGEGEDRDYYGEWNRMDMRTVHTDSAHRRLVNVISITRFFAQFYIRNFNLCVNAASGRYFYEGTSHFSSSVMSRPLIS